LFVSLASFGSLAWALNTRQLDPEERVTLQTILETLDPIIAERRADGTASLLTWQELDAPLTAEQRVFLDAFRALKAETLGATSHYFGEVEAELVGVGQQSITKDGVVTPLDPQYLPHPVLTAYEQMMSAMEAELGTRLLVESGYRSPAYQLYLFLYYLPTHEHSIEETNRFVALPGHSEHGYPLRQAIDFITPAGVNGEDDPEAFEALAEYQWLQERAGEFGFSLSYPRDNPYNTAFEPWHWHYEGAGGMGRGAARDPGN